MEYVILDLEWDSCYFKEESRFINHILQIGAVRLDENFNTVGEFSQTIRSELSKRVSGHFVKLTGITKEQMLNGISFKEAVEKYNEFASGADVTMTWSNSDIYTIIENEEHILKGSAHFGINKYLDLQKFVQNELSKAGYDSKNQISLESAAELLGFDTEGYELHTALDDCRVCALMFKKCYEKEKFNSLVKEVTPEFYERLMFKPYPISDINDSNIKPDFLEFKCPECSGKTRRLNRWKYRNRWFVSDFKCENCGFKFNGRVAIKKTYDDLAVKQKICEYKPKAKKKDDMQSVST